MRGSPEERAAVKKSFQRMNFKEKAAYIATYYRLPLFTAFVVLAVLISSIYRQVTKKEVILYEAYINFVAGETLTGELTDDYLAYTERDPKKTDVLVYADLYIDEDPTIPDHQYAYASKMKILGAISAKQMDIAIMNDNAYQQMSESGLLMNIDSVLSEEPAIREKLEPYITEGTVILEDNSVEYDLNETDQYEAVTEEVRNAVNVSSFPVFTNAGIGDNLYIGVIANTRHVDEVPVFLEYLLNLK